MDIQFAYPCKHGNVQHNSIDSDMLVCLLCFLLLVALANVHDALSPKPGMELLGRWKQHAGRAPGAN